MGRLGRGAAAALVLTAGQVGADAPGAAHHGVLGGGASAARPAAVRWSAAIVDAGDLLSIDMAGTVVAVVPFGHGGATACLAAARCQTPPPQRSADLQLGRGATWTVDGDWALPAGAALTIDLGSAGTALLNVRGALAATGPGLFVGVYGTPAYLPLPLAIADTISGALWPVALPAGTGLSVVPGGLVSILYLVGVP